MGDDRRWLGLGPKKEIAGRTTEPRRGIPTFLKGLAVGAVIVGLAWTEFALVTSGSSEDSTATAGRAGSDVGAQRHATGTPSDSPSDVPSASPSASPPARPSALERCAVAAATLEAPIRAAGPAMDQWEVHVGAMNKLVVGQITLAQANAFWDQTRMLAHRHIHAFNAADSRVGPLACPAPDRLPATADPARRCAARVHAEADALRAARTAIDTWQMHVHHMEMLRMGMMSGARASQLWLTMWQRGVRELHAYRTASARAERTGGCPDASAGSAVGSEPGPAGESSPMQMDMG